MIIDLHKFGQTVFQTSVEGAVKTLNIVQDKVHGTCYLLVRFTMFTLPTIVSLQFNRITQCCVLPTLFVVVNNIEQYC